MTKKVLQWIFFGVLIGITPLLVALLIGITKDSTTNLVDVLDNGELLLVTVGIAGAAVGDLLAGSHRFPELEIVSGGGCIFILVISSIYFADISATTTSSLNSSLDLSVIEKYSYFLFTGGFISSMASVILSEL